MAKVLITGGTGLIGRHLYKKLLEKGYDVAILSRSKQQDPKILSYTWDLDANEIEREAIESADYIVHLAGTNIGDKRWSVKRKQSIIDSRVKTTELIFSKIKAQNKKLKAFISASGIGYYSESPSDRIFVEADAPGKNFLADVCREWEQSADQFKTLAIRTVIIRTGVVLTRRGGALSKMITPVKMGIGSGLGHGRQYMPWIHINDLCNIYIKAIEDTQMQGVFNAVAPDHKTNIQFIKTLARVLNRPFWFPKVPAFMLKLMFGEMSGIILKGNRVSAKKIEETGYEFLFPNLEAAFTNLLKNGRHSS